MAQAEGQKESEKVARTAQIAADKLEVEVNRRAQGSIRDAEAKLLTNRFPMPAGTRLPLTPLTPVELQAMGFGSAASP